MAEAVGAGTRQKGSVISGPGKRGARELVPHYTVGIGREVLSDNFVLGSDKALSSPESGGDGDGVMEGDLAQS